jgi:hypothetical protein
VATKAIEAQNAALAAKAAREMVCLCVFFKLVREIMLT